MSLGSYTEEVPFYARAFDPAETIPHRIETVAAHDSNRLAAKGKDSAFTYGELCAYANGVARLVVGATPPGARVIVYLGHGARVIAVIVGVLKAARVYVPVDPAYPAARNGLIIADADASVILTDSANLAGAREIACGALTVINLDEDMTSATEDVGKLAAATSPACLIYTSGSTGKPKGVIHTHQSLLHDAYRRGLLLQIAHDDRMTLLYSSSVMGAAHGIFTALSCGASLLVNSLRNDSVSSLLDWIREEQITVYHSVATVFRELASQMRPGDTFPTVRLLVFGGERVLRADLENAWRWFPVESKIFVGYGTTEVATALGWVFDRTAVFEGDIVPSGYPVSGVQVGISTGTEDAAVLGRAGEITITSPFIFQGYWRDPESTNAVLVQHATGDDHRTYRSGDQGVVLPDGRFIVIGRKDTQLTIRGFRVETGEIESVFLTHPEVRHASVVLHDRNMPNPVLAAFIVHRPGGRITPKELWNHAQKCLPPHMVPSRYAILDRLPTTPNGKTDRACLESWKAFPIMDTEDYVPPRDEIDAALVGVAEEILGYSPLGIRTNLLEAGLTSLMAVRLLSEIERNSDCRVPLSVLFDAPTIAALAGRLRNNVPSAAASPIIVINPDGVRPPAVGLPGIGGVASFTYRALAEYIGQDQPFYTLQLQGLDGDAQVYNTVEDMAAHHIAAVRKLQPEGPYRLVGYSFGGRLAFEMAHQLRSAGQDVALLALLDTFAPGYPKRAPLPVRCRLHLRLLAHMTRSERLGYLRDRVTSMKRRGADFVKRHRPHDPEQPAATLDKRIKNVLKVTQQASARYKPPVYPGNIVLFRAADRPDWLGSSFEDLQNGWGAYTTGTIDVRMIPGAHLDMLKPPSVQVLARELRACLDDAMTRAVE